MSIGLHQRLEELVRDTLAAMGAPDPDMRLVACPKKEIGDAAVSAALRAARTLRRAPGAIAGDIAIALLASPDVADAVATPNGYVNIRFADIAIAAALEGQLGDSRSGLRKVDAPERIVIDFGGPNIKPMHVGHMRSLFIGEALRRMLVAVGHDVVSDIHLGDWGLPAGMILDSLRYRWPGGKGLKGLATRVLMFVRKTPLLVAILMNRTGSRSAERSPVALLKLDEVFFHVARVPVAPDELGTLYPAASRACKASPLRMEAARAMTAALQAGEPRLGALWMSIVGTAKSAILQTCGRMGAHFDLVLGESDAQAEISPMLARFQAEGIVRQDNNALLIDVASPDDRKEVPPLVVSKGDGSALYATTDLATLLARVRDLHADRVVYVVDERQSLHFLSVFRAAVRSGIAGSASLEHVGFGTVNGPDGRPFRTRDGGTMSLEALLDLARDRALERLVSGGRLGSASDEELADAADAIGLAALRICDLSGHRIGGYILDLDRALAFEGRTGPHLLYAAVRMRSVLSGGNLESGPVMLGCPAERSLALACLGLDDAVARSLANRTPHDLVAWTFDLSDAIGRFWVDCPVVSEADPVIRASRVSLCVAADKALSVALDLLGCRVPAAM